MLLADGFEELEFIAPWDILIRGGLQVQTASVSGRLDVSSVRGLSVRADSTLESVMNESFDLVFLPGGGPGTKNLRASALVVERVKKQVQAGGAVAAICAAPLVLGDALLTIGKNVTCFPSCQAELAPMAGTIVQDRVAHDGLIWTSRGAGSAAEFGFALLAHFASPQKSAEVLAQMQFPQ